MANKQEQLNLITTSIEENMVCPLKDAATNLVFGKGNPEAPILFIGEAPGAKEDEQGVPFVGAAGKKLDTLLQSIGFTLEQCYIANILKYRPPQNRDPNVEEIRRHTPYLIEQIKVISPKVICTLGNFSTKFVLAKFDVDGMKQVEGISALHGKVQPIQINDHSFSVVPLFHPAATIYRPQLWDVLLEDFQTIKTLM